MTRGGGHHGGSRHSGGGGSRHSGGGGSHHGGGHHSGGHRDGGYRSRNNYRENNFERGRHDSDHNRRNHDQHRRNHHHHDYDDSRRQSTFSLFRNVSIDHQYNSNENQRENNDDRSNYLIDMNSEYAGCFCCGLPFALFLLMFILSPSTLHYELTVGDTRRIPVKTSLLTKSVEMSYIGNVAAFMYHFPSKCPPLRKAPNKITDSSNLSLFEGDYEFDYYYLNPGSHIDATLSLTESGGDLILVRTLLKQKILFGDIFPTNDDEYADDRNDDYRNNDDEYELTYANGVELYSTYTSANNSPARISYTVQIEGYYYVIYNNVHNQHLQGKSTVSVSFTTYDITGKSPEIKNCTNNDSKCTIDLPRGQKVGCIIVAVPDSKVVSDWSNNTAIDNKADGGSDSLNENVTVSISRYRRWLMIFLITFAPLLLFGFVQIIDSMTIQIEEASKRHRAKKSETKAKNKKVSIISEASTLEYPSENPRYNSMSQPSLSSYGNKIPLVRAVTYPYAPSAPSTPSTPSAPSAPSTPPTPSAPAFYK